MQSVWRRRLGTLAGSIVLLCGVGAVIGLIGWTKFQQVRASMAEPPPPEMSVTVTFAAPQPAQFRSSTVVVGSVLAHRSVVVRNQETGIVTAVHMEPGGRVKAGDVLVQIDDRVEQAALKSASATLREAQLSLERAQKLQRTNANTAQDIDLATANQQRAQAEVDRLTALVDRRSIKAEFDATVGLFDLHPGQYLDAGTDIATLEGIADYLFVDFSVPAHVADQISVEDKVQLRANDQSEPLTATITAMDSRADPQSRALVVRATLNSAPKTLLPGDSVLVTVYYGPAIDCLLVPQTAVRQGPTGASVFLAVEEQDEQSDTVSLRARSVAVHVAGGDGEYSRILKGVSQGQMIVADGSFKVVEGALLGQTTEGENLPTSELEVTP